MSQRREEKQVQREPTEKERAEAHRSEANRHLRNAVALTEDSKASGQESLECVGQCPPQGGSATTL